MTRRTLCILLIAIAAMAFSACRGHTEPPAGDAIPAPGFVAIEGDHFVVDGELWFPKMLNYKCFFAESDGTLAVVPAPWYTGDNMRAHFDTIAAWGFNAVRLCLDGDWRDGDTAAMRRATRRAVLQAESAGLRVMLLIHPPLDTYWTEYTKGLLRSLADLPALWAYDFMNEPLYFDPAPQRDKMKAHRIVSKWRDMVRRNAPHQLFTIGFAEPIEVFEWDPSLLPVDFVEVHTYHPLRVQAEMWWYSHYCGKPWMVGETGLPADGDSVPYGAQEAFMFWTYRYATLRGAAGYGWWEFQDCPDGVNFEAQYTGLRDSIGRAKPAADFFRHWICLGVALDEDYLPPVNYGNMLAYRNLAVVGRVVDDDGLPIDGAVVRGWNDDWSVGMNTFSDSTGRFRLVSNDICTHFEVSAPGCSKVKFDWRKSGIDASGLPDRGREYQQIPVIGWGEEYGILPFKDSASYAADGATVADMGDVRLENLLKTK